MPEAAAPLVLINAVGLTPRLLPFANGLHQLAEQGWARPMRAALPAVTCTAQASLLTGTAPDKHGIVANGWLFRDTREVRFWQQSNALLQAEPLYVTAARRARARGRDFRCAKLFWWFNQGAAVDLSLTPKPYYGADGNKAFSITGTPESLPSVVESELGHFPFPSFWGPRAGLPATQWIADAAAAVLAKHRPDLTLVYLPHLDYDPQRHGPAGCDMRALVQELDNACGRLRDAARAAGAQVWVVSEYGHCDVARAAQPNSALRRAGLLTVRDGPFGETIDFFQSRAFAVCDHQLAHVYVAHPRDFEVVKSLLLDDPCIDRVYTGPERAELGLDHPRGGELVALSKPDAWFAYPYWLDDAHAPDFARTVDIHRKPGFDPCELFLNPALRLPQLRIARRLLQKKLGFRTLFDVIPLDPSIVRGSHGLATAPEDGPLIIGPGHAPSPSEVAMTDVRDLLLAALDLSDE